ncbi:hypothetical protein THAOC_10342 [Thalassiosira oceanica]|uniref:Uncharacterized protein n=1 Tax=Thalassiosira oceanica TaxID=159749 RepID=K0T528_THAOC|nr:hypothetical protein THAOC_10342 [Thalassiosira oceanica]|eukprot:EJK68471.1 hypothetical protein THAOC_10342 [Thalassiosira oceanica]
MSTDIVDGSRPSLTQTPTSSGPLSTEKLPTDRPIDHARLRRRLPDAMPFPHRQRAADELCIALPTAYGFCSGLLLHGGLIRRRVRRRSVTSSRVSLRTAQPTTPGLPPGRLRLLLDQGPRADSPACAYVVSSSWDPRVPDRPPSLPVDKDRTPVFEVVGFSYVGSRLALRASADGTSVTKNLD